MIRTCKRHGEIEHRPRTEGGWRCSQCANEAVVKRRRKTKQILVEEAGGKCQKCGYNKCIGALQFHHLDPKTKTFGISGAGMTRSLAKARAEASKCILLCANCHAEVEYQSLVM